MTTRAGQGTGRGNGMAERARRDPGEAGRRRVAVAGQRARARRALDGAVPGRPAGTAVLDGAVLDRPAVRAPRSAPEVHGEPAAASATRARRRPARSLVLVVALACLASALAATAGLVGYRAREAARAEDARTAALAAARAHAVDVLSYDYRTLDRDFARARQVITGSFGEDYAATTGKVVRPTAEKYKAAVKAEVAAASVVSAAPDRVTVLLFVNQTTTSTRLDGPRVDLNRVRMTLVREGGNWLVSDIDAL